MEDEFDIRDVRMPETEREYENALRPLSFSDFSGQAKVVENLKIFVMAARMRKEALDHVLLHGPPGLGNPHYPISLPMSWVWVFRLLRGRFGWTRSNWPAYSPPCKRVQYVF